MALFLCMNALEYIKTREFGKYLAWVVAGICFHYTAVVFLLLYFVLNVRLNKYWFAAVVLVANVIYIFRIPVVMSILALIFKGDNVY
jgi:hypothetical protein